VNKKPSTRKLILYLLIVFSFTKAHSQTFPRIEPDPKALEFFALGETREALLWTDLARISLWASGDSAPSNYEKIIAAASALSASANLPEDNIEKAEFILSYMHKNILKNYSLYQTRIDTMLNNGRYNCVSSAVLYAILCKSAGIEASGVMTKDHAFVTVHIGEADIDVETTNIYGFDPGNKKEFTDQFGKATGFAYVSPRNYRERQTISAIELISLIMNNRVSELERQNKFQEAVPISIDRAVLLNGLSVNYAMNSSNSIFTDPYQDLMDRLFNYGAWLLKSGKEENCLQWALFASAMYPDKERWEEFTNAAINNLIMKLTKAGKLDEARKVLNAQAAILSNASYIIIENNIVDMELYASANKIKSANDGDYVLEAIEQARNKSNISEKRAVELITFSVIKTASALSGSKNWPPAIEYVKAKLERYGPVRELENALKTYRSNLAADYHNRFASAWNRKNFDEAQRILAEGLKELPDDKQLLSDQETVKKNLR
jgi:hypothetical protein